MSPLQDVFEDGKLVDLVQPTTLENVFVVSSDENQRYAARLALAAGTH